MASYDVMAAEGHYWARYWPRSLTSLSIIAKALALYTDAHVLSLGLERR